MTALKKKSAPPVAKRAAYGVIGGTFAVSLPKRRASAKAPTKGRITLGLYQNQLLIAPDFFEPHEIPPGLESRAA